MTTTPLRLDPEHAHRQLEILLADVARKLQSARRTLRSQLRRPLAKRPLRRITILVEPWQIEAARLLGAADGTTYQQRFRLWIEVAARAEAMLG